jgi:hypothetical protein
MGNYGAAIFLEYAGDLRINILRRKGYRTQTTTHNRTKQLDTQKERKKKKNKLAKDCKQSSTKQPRPTN